MEQNNGKNDFHAIRIFSKLKEKKNVLKLLITNKSF